MTGKNTSLPSPLKRAQLGEIGAPRAADRPASDAPERFDVKTLEHNGVETIERYGDKAAGSSAEMKRQTVYMPKELATWLKVHAALTGDDISGVITRLVEHYRAQQQPNNGQ